MPSKLVRLQEIQIQKMKKMIIRIMTILLSQDVKSLLITHNTLQHIRNRYHHLTHHHFHNHYLLWHHYLL